MITTSLSAMPRRGTLFAAKAVVFSAVALVSGLITCFASFFIGQAIMSSHHMNTTLSQPGVLRAVIGGALFLAACGLLAFGIGAAPAAHRGRDHAPSSALLFVLSILINFLPQSWQIHVDKWMPAVRRQPGLDGGSVAGTGHRVLRPGPGSRCSCGYAAIAIAAGLILFRRRDA